MITQYFTGKAQKFVVWS